jgi:hypothetical protein
MLDVGIGGRGVTSPAFHAPVFVVNPPSREADLRRAGEPRTRSVTDGPRHCPSTWRVEGPRGDKDHTASRVGGAGGAPSSGSTCTRRRHNRPNCGYTCRGPSCSAGGGAVSACSTEGGGSVESSWLRGGEVDENGADTSTSACVRPSSGVAARSLAFRRAAPLDRLPRDESRASPRKRAAGDRRLVEWRRGHTIRSA